MDLSLGTDGISNLTSPVGRLKYGREISIAPTGLGVLVVGTLYPALKYRAIISRPYRAKHVWVLCTHAGRGSHSIACV